MNVPIVQEMWHLTGAPLGACRGLCVADVAVALGAVLRIGGTLLGAEGVDAALRPAVRQVLVPDLMEAASTAIVTSPYCLLG